MKFSLVKDGITPDITRAQKELAEVAEGAYKIFRSHTPIRSGNARRRTTLDNKTTIVANYAYAQRLDQGASNQAPDGMTKPTEAYMKRTFDKIMKGR
jgi:hypothetical protein